MGTSCKFLEDSLKIFLSRSVSHTSQVTDEQGRRRFHGAFTGGFSAGYFNSVGSKEGWTPSTFVSSRSSRAQQHQQSAADFADDEDIRAGVVGGTQLAASSQYVQSEQPKLADPLLNMLLVRQSSVGTKLLRTMKLKKLVQDREDEEQDESEEKVESFSVELRPKENVFGLGYDPYRSAPEFRGRNRTAALQAKRGAFGVFGSNGGFGVGALEKDAEPDVYDADDLANYDRELDDGDALEKPKQGQHEPQRSDRHAERCSDGTLVLEGFALAKQKQREEKWFKAPIVPPEFKALHVFPINSTSGNIASSSAAQRAVLLNEAPHPYNEPEPEPDEATSNELRELAERTRKQERDDFAKVNAAFKPIADAMAMRFVRSTSVSIEPSLPTGLTVKPQSTPQQPQLQQAAKAKQEITHKEEEWWPENLLCKRFNIRNPFFGQTKPAELPQSRSEQAWNDVVLKAGIQTKPVEQAAAPKRENPFAMRRDIKAILEQSDSESEGEGEGKQNAKVQEPQESQESQESRISVEMFKEIFENDSGSEGESESEHEAKATHKEGIAPVQPEASKSVEIAREDYNVMPGEREQDERPVRNSWATPNAFASSTHDNSMWIEKGTQLKRKHDEKSKHKKSKHEKSKREKSKHKDKKHKHKDKKHKHKDKKHKDRKHKKDK